MTLFKIPGRKKEAKVVKNTQTQIMDAAACPHGALVMAETKGEFTDEDVRLYVCLRCGMPVLCAPVTKFNDQPEAKAFFKKIAEEVQLSLPRLK